MLDYLQTMKANINHEESMGFKTATRPQVIPTNETIREMSLFYPDNGAHFKEGVTKNNR